MWYDMILRNSLDWLAVAINLVGIVLLPTWPKVALMVYSTANVLMFVWAIHKHRSVAIAVSQVLFLALNVRAYIIWSQPTQ